MSKLRLGSLVYGYAAVLFGIFCFVWRDLNSWERIGNFPHGEFVAYIAGSIQLLGGLAIQWPRTERYGAFALGFVYLLFASFHLPHILTTPIAYPDWGGFFEECSLVSGALIVCSSSDASDIERTSWVAKLGCIFFVICTISFAWSRVNLFPATMNTVPKWMPPGQLFWAIAVRAAFGLCAIALLSGRSARVVTQALTAALVLFAILVWLPLSLFDPRDLDNWAGFAQTPGIAGVSWIVFDFLSQPNVVPPTWPFAHALVKRQWHHNRRRQS